MKVIWKNYPLYEKGQYLKKEGMVATVVAEAWIDRLFTPGIGILKGQEQVMTLQSRITHHCEQIYWVRALNLK